MKKLLCLSALFTWLALLAGCSSVSVQDYAGNKPRLVIEEYFNGHLIAQGIVKNRSGQVTRFFRADIMASWKDGVGTLDEKFVFDDGELQSRIWTLQPDGNGGYIGSANDVVGETRLKLAGNSLFMEYVLRIPYGEDTLDLTIDDRMYLVSETVLLNESSMSKWGFGVGEINLVIEKQ